MTTTNDNYSKHVRRVATVLETVSGINSLIVTREAINTAKGIVADIEGLSSDERFLILAGATQLVEDMQADVKGSNLTNNCRGSITRHGTTQHVVGVYKGEC